MINIADIAKTDAPETIYLPIKYQTILGYVFDKNSMPYRQIRASQMRNARELDKIRTGWAARFEELDGRHYTCHDTCGFTADLSADTMYDLCRKALDDDDVKRMLNTCNL